MEERFNAVYADAEREPASYAVIMVNGAKGVGEAQFNEGCKGCQHYGALLGTAPGKEARVTGDMCFNLDCLKGKQAEYLHHYLGCRRLLDRFKGSVIAEQFLYHALRQNMSPEHSP